jgi:endoglucanase
MTYRKPIAFLCFAAQALAGCTSDDAQPPPANGFVHVEQGRVVDGAGRALWLRGMNFADWYWSVDEIPVEHHDERDYERIAAMGMNTVRLWFNYGFIEDASQPDGLRADGVAWLDQNVEWARAHGLYLVPSLNVPPGGGPAACSSDAFWEGAEYQDRFVRLWRALAERYASERVIAGYALSSHPDPNTSLEQWQTLAERTASSIREVDENHMLLAARAHAIGCAFDKVAAETFVRLDDQNVLYEFDRMQPWYYVAQLLENEGLPEYGAYPGPGVEKWIHGSWDSRPGPGELRLLPEDTAWTLRHFYYTVTDPKITRGYPSLQSDFNSGTVYFDDITINELDENGAFVRTVMEIDIESDRGWTLWEGIDDVKVDGDGVVATAPDGHIGNASITLSGTSTYANLSSDAYRFPVVLGHTYEVTSYIKGENSSPSGVSLVRLDFFGVGSGDGVFDKTGLDGLFDDFVSWGEERRLPLNVNTFGTGRPTFEQHRGGLTWASDIIDVMIDRKLHFTYYAYHDEEWGIYGNATGLPDEATVNQPLVDLFTEKLR